MGVLRLPLSIGTHASSHPTRTITSDMISPPLSPDFNFDSDALMPCVLPALEYISKKLQRKLMHVTLLVGREQPFPTGDGTDLLVIPVSELDPPSWKTFYRIIEKAAKRFSLGQSWITALSRDQRQRLNNEYLVQQSLKQNDILFSQEGLTLLGVDRLYTFKRRLCVLSLSKNNVSEERYINSCVHLLHQTICEFQGRPFSQGFFHRIYEFLNVSNDVLAKVAIAYKDKYQQDGIVLPRPVMKSRIEHPRRSSGRNQRIRRPPSARYCPPSSTPSRTSSKNTSRSGTPKRGPPTPLSASDVTPITRNEWNILIGPDFGHKPTVTIHGVIMINLEWNNPKNMTGVSKDVLRQTRHRIGTNNRSAKEATDWPIRSMFPNVRSLTASICFLTIRKVDLPAIDAHGIQTRTICIYWSDLAKQKRSRHYIHDYCT